MDLSRRDLLRFGLLGSAALYLPVQRLARAADFRSLTKLPAPYSYPFTRPPSIDLRAAADWHALGDELRAGLPARTDLGREHEQWRARRIA